MLSALLQAVEDHGEGSDCLLASWATAVLTPGAEDTAVPGGWREMPCPSVGLEPPLSVALAKFGCITSEPLPMVKDKKPLLPLP